LPALDLTIGERKMRWEESNGMICSKKELGFNEDEEFHWIWTLQLSKNPEDYAALPDEWKGLQGEFYALTDDDCWKPLKEVFPWMESFVLDVDNKTLTHRADLFGHFGLAKEIGGIYMHLGHRERSEAERGDPNGLLRSSQWQGTKIAIQTSLCSFYGAISWTIKSIDEQVAREKRFKWRMMLRDLWLQPRHDWVNFSNLYMYMTGQPIHVFDAEKISWTITVRQAEEGEKFLDLTGKEHTLSIDDIVIADEKGVLALAGIYGWLDSWVSETTKNILIEIAHFDPVQVRKTGMRLWIRTDAQQRYEKYINPLWTRQCFESMREEFWLDEVMGEIVESRKSKVENEQSTATITYNLDRCSKLIYGDETSLEEQDFCKVLTWLGFLCEGNRVTVPVWRSPHDITIEDDLVEEYIRIKGYETVETKQLTATLETIPLSDEARTQRYIEQALVRQQFSQIETYPRCSQQQILDLWIGLEDCYLIKNPIDTNQPYLRPTMLWSMLGAVAKNILTFESMKLFDTGKIWKLGNEQDFLWLCIVAKQSDDLMQHPYISMKSIVESIMSNVECMQFLEHTTKQWQQLFHPLQNADIYKDGFVIGQMATIHPVTLATLGIPEDTIVVWAEFPTDLCGPHTGPVVYTSNDQQLLRKEAGFLFDKVMSYDILMQKVKDIPWVKSAKIVDIYVWDRIPAEKKNVTISIEVDVTGKDGEYANEVLGNLIEVGKECGGEMRI
jgi:phenylalanyl-tRNA synthetase beta chain